MGCAALDTTRQLQLPLVSPADKAVQTETTPSTLHCTVVLQPSGSPPETMKMPLSDSATVQTALDHVRAAKRFRKMDIHVFRTPPNHASGNAGLQKMNVQYDYVRRRATWESDYQLHPNDRVIIVEDPSNMLDEMLGGLTKAIGGPMGTR